MKSFICVLIWTILFILFGVYVNKGIGDFTDLYKDEIIVIESYIENDNWHDAKIQITKLKNSWFEKKDIWYKLLNHEPFDEISLHINILDKCINIKDKSKSLENIEIIKTTLENILENETYDIQHIL